MQVFLWTFLFRQDYNFKTIRSFLGQRKDSYQIHVKACYKKVKKYIDEEQDYKSPLTIDEILLKLDISKEDYYYALSISVDDDYELHLIRPPNSCLSITILTQVEGHGKQIWLYNQPSMSIKLLHIYVPIFQNLKISVHLP